jgi:hypothetical protein
VIPALFAIASAVTALAVLSRVSGTDEWAIEPYAGVLLVDDWEPAVETSERFDAESAAPLVGVRVLVPVSDRWESGAEVGATSFDVTMDFPDEPGDFVLKSDVTAHAFLGIVRRSWPFDRTALTATAGVGALRMDADEVVSGRSSGDLAPADVAPPDPAVEHEPILTLGVGARRGLYERIAVTAEARDLLHRCEGVSEGTFPQEASDVFCGRDAWLHHLQLTASLRVEF